MSCLLYMRRVEHIPMFQVPINIEMFFTASHEECWFFICCTIWQKTSLDCKEKVENTISQIGKMARPVRQRQLTTGNGPYNAEPRQSRSPVQNCWDTWICLHYFVFSFLTFPCPSNWTQHPPLPPEKRGIGNVLTLKCVERCTTEIWIQSTFTGHNPGPFQDKGIGEGRGGEGGGWLQVQAVVNNWNFARDPQLCAA